MNNNFTFYLVLLALVISIVFTSLQEKEITELEIKLAEKPKIVEIEVEKEVKVIIEGMYGDCRIDYEGDLIQPSGLWHRYDLTCWKLEQTLQEYCDNPKADKRECITN